MLRALTLIILSLVTSGVHAETAKPFNLETQNGRIDLQSLKGKVVYVDFWASWCAPCRKSFPWMNKMQTKYKDNDLVIIGINLDSKRKHADNFLEKNPVLFTVAFDPSGTTADAYNVQVMPTSYLIDRQGEIIMEHKGFLSRQQDKLEKSLQDALKNP